MWSSNFDRSAAKSGIWLFARCRCLNKQIWIRKFVTKVLAPPSNGFAKLCKAQYKFPLLPNCFAACLSTPSRLNVLLLRASSHHHKLVSPSSSFVFRKSNLTRNQSCYYWNFFSLLSPSTVSGSAPDLPIMTGTMRQKTRKMVNVITRITDYLDGRGGELGECQKIWLAFAKSAFFWAGNRKFSKYPNQSYFLSITTVTRQNAIQWFQWRFKLGEQKNRQDLCRSAIWKWSH